MPTDIAKSDLSIVADNPIKNPKDDALSRAGIALSFARHVLSLDATAGVVVGVLGPWGSGKTSFVNMARGYLEESSVTVLEFNPWMFSGAEQLVEAFFVELSAQLKVRAGLAEIGKLVEDYGETFSGLSWLPLVGPWIERGRATTKLLAKLLQRKKEGISGRRSRLQKALARLETPIVVVLDDIDRLTTSEIRDVFKLVRLTASFPSVIYLLAFDRLRVETALGEQGIPGRDYLEKILQIGIDLPAVPADLLNSQVFKAIEAALVNVEDRGFFDQNTWQDIFIEVIRPLIRNMRDVRRYAAAIYGTVRDLRGQVALTDVLALEALRVFLPDVFRGLHGAMDALTSTSNGFGARGNADRLKQQIDVLIQEAGAQGEVVRTLIRRLFPAGQRHVGGSEYGNEWKNQWLRDRRVAHEDVLRLYLERVMGERLLAFTDAEKAWVRIADRSAFESYLRSLDIERLQDVISSLEAYEDQFEPQYVVPASVVLLNLLPTLPERQRGMFEPDGRLVVGRVVYRLVRALKDPPAVEIAVREILPHVLSLFSKLELITKVGYREGAGHKLVSEAAAKAFESEWRNAVRMASADRLAEEMELLRVFLTTKRDADPDEPTVVVPESPRVTYAILRSARSEALSQTAGSRGVRRSPRLAWDALIELYGDEAILHTRFDALKASDFAQDGELLRLAEKYLGGWLPGDVDD